MQSKDAVCQKRIQMANRLILGQDQTAFVVYLITQATKTPSDRKTRVHYTKMIEVGVKLLTLGYDEKFNIIFHNEIIEFNKDRNATE